MPSITLRHELNTDEETYWAKIVFDETFNKKMYVDHMHFPVWKLLDQKEDDAKLTRRIQVDPPVGNLPGPLKKVIGDRLSYTEDGTFDKKTKKYSFKVTPSTMTDKTKVNGEMWVEKAGDKKVTRICRIDVEVKVFMVGGMVEERILSDLRDAYDRGTIFTNDYIKANGL
ncbi:hypothetical protein AKJ09_02756 [Labilithrix luteola]|uniref:DUF2505 domain-containing protein n=1 Tax=Labilithrix luteola TaxID=1391654 RepID=A0A0K1PRE5_9BACT|nr:DUF2505 family protein [Labilithrix luteola]AKU96092.1 hypothetical protein AKJ09_02756 [Labilithrix luteola]